MNPDNDDREDRESGTPSHLVWFLCFLAVWVLILCIYLILRGGWTFPEF